MVRTACFRALGERSMPLVNAIVNFSQVKHRPPKELTELVPNFIPQIPTTGMGAYPEYQYEVFDDKGSASLWELRVPCSVGMLNWDVFFYWPREKYPSHIYGGWVEAMGKWAYVHE